MFPDLLTDDSFRLETGRLWLRWPRASDLPQLVKLAGNWQVARYTARVPHPYQPADAPAFILACRKANALGKGIGLAVTPKGKSDELIGMIGAQTKANRAVSIGYWLGEPFWGDGLMGEALDEIVALIFQVTRTEQISAMVRKENTLSTRLLTSRGFEPGKSRRVNMPLRGGAFTCTKFELQKGIWRQNEQQRYRRRADRSPAPAQPAI